MLKGRQRPHFLTYPYHSAIEFRMAESYLEPLRHLTKNGFDDARLLLLQGLSREQRSALIREGMEHFTTDEASVQLCLSMLDCFNNHNSGRRLS